MNLKTLAQQKKPMNKTQNNNIWNGRKHWKLCDQQGINFQTTQIAQYL